MKDFLSVVTYIAEVDGKEVSKLLFKYKLVCTDWKQSDFTESELHRDESWNFSPSHDLDRVTKLPDNLHIDGYLSLRNSLINKLPNNLYVDEILDLRYSKIRKLPVDLKVRGIIIVDSELVQFMRNLNPKFSRRIKNA